MMWRNLKELIFNIREYVWPLLEPLENNDVSEIKEEDYNWEEQDLDLMLEYANKYYDSEETRKKDVEAKSTIFIGIFGAVATILIYLSKDLVLNDSIYQSPFMLIVVILITLSVIYLCRAIWFSIKTLQRQNYYRVSFPKFMFTNNINKKKKLIIRLYNCTKKNTEIVNLKVDFMTMAQEYFKRVVILWAFFSFLILGKYLFFYENILVDIFNILSDIKIEKYILSIIIVVLIILSVFVAVIFHKVFKKSL